MNAQVLPWYKYKLVWMIIAIPAASVIAGINMIYLAVNTDDGLVADDYYKEGMAINQNLKRDRTAAELGLGAELVIEDTFDRDDLGDARTGIAGRNCRPVGRVDNPRTILPVAGDGLWVNAVYD